MTFLCSSWRKSFCAALLSVLLPFRGIGQAATDEGWTTAPAGNHAFLIIQADTISRPAALRPLFGKLQRMHKTATGQVRIVHIGDSHTQADMMTGVVRRGMQHYFGNAGRGLVFPYQVARSNAPLDIVSSSGHAWQYNRLARTDKPLVCGISGFGIHCGAPKASLKLGLKTDSSWDNSFDLVRFFLNEGPGCYTATTPDGTALTGRRHDDSTALVFHLPAPVSSLTFSRCEDTAAAAIMSLYGASLEKQGATGVLYHTIGVNGAMYGQYNNTQLFWQQLPALEADCFIVSLGTNEAQRRFINKPAFIAECRAFVQNLRRAAPGAVILITTPAGSHTQAGKPNAVLEQVRDALADFCAEESLPLWDLYRMTGGYRNAPLWKRAGLMSHDGIHYNGQGYALQGKLLLRALAQAYAKTAAR